MTTIESHNQVKGEETGQQTVWTNGGNDKFYNHFDIDTLKNYAKVGGVARGEDLDVIWDEVKGMNSILDVGAAYGRIESLLIQRKFAGKTTALERSELFYNELQAYKSEAIETLKADIMQWESSARYEGILCMWSVITDFNRFEQAALLGRLKERLLPGGVLFFEAFSFQDQPLNTDDLQGQEYSANYKGNTVHGYLPSYEDMLEYCAPLALKLEMRPYLTATNRPRNMFICRS